MSEAVPDFLRPVSRRIDDLLEPDVSVPSTPTKQLQVVDVKQDLHGQENLMVKLFVRGTPITEIADALKLPYDDVSDFLTGFVGAGMIRQASGDDRERSVRDMLEAAQVDTILQLLRLRDHGENGPTRIAAGKELTSMLTSLGPKKGLRNMSPDQAVNEARKRLEKLEGKFK